MSRGIKPDPNCPLISQSLLKSGVIHKLTAKYLVSVISIARKNKKIVFYPNHNSESFQIADELVLKYLARFELKYTSDAFRLESNFTFSNPSLPVKRLKLTYSQDPLKNFLKIIEKSPHLRFHDTVVIQALLLKVPSLIDEKTKTHFLNILKKAGNFSSADENAIYSIIQNNNIYRYSNKNEEKDLKKISQSEPPKPPTSSNKNKDDKDAILSNKLRARKSDMTDINRQSKSRENSNTSKLNQRSNSSYSFNSTSPKEENKTNKGSSATEANPQPVVAQITFANHNAYSCNPIKNESGLDNYPKFTRSQAKTKGNQTKNDERIAKTTTLSEYAHSASSYYYEYETISEPEQIPSEGSLSSTQSEVGQLKSPNTEKADQSKLQNSNAQKKQSGSMKTFENSRYGVKNPKTDGMSIIDQIEYFDIKNKNTRQTSPIHQTQPAPSPRFYRLPIPDDDESNTKNAKSSRAYREKQQNLNQATSSSARPKATNVTNSNKTQKVMAKINKLQKELEALQSDKDSDSYSSEQEDSKITQLQKTLANAVKETSSSIKRNSRIISSSSDDDDKNQNLRNKQKTTSKTSFGATLLEQKKNAKPTHHSRSHRENDASTKVVTESVSASNSKSNNINNNEKEKPTIVILKNTENPSRTRTISEQKQIDKKNEKEKEKNNKNYNQPQPKTKEAPPIDNQPETYRLTLPADPLKSYNTDKKKSKETSQQRQSQNQKQSSRLNQSQKPNQSQSQSQRQIQTSNQKLQPNQSQSQRPVQKQQPQQKQQTKSQQKNANLADDDDDELISDSPPPAMKQLWESKNQNKSKTSNTSNATSSNTNNTIKSSTNKEKSKNDELLKISNQNSSSSLYDAFVEAEKREKSQQQSQNQKQERKPQPKEQPKKQEERKTSTTTTINNNNNNAKQNPTQQKLDFTKSSSSITFKQPVNEPSKSTTKTNTNANINEASKAKTIDPKQSVSLSKSSSNVTMNTNASSSKYTTHAKTGSSMSTSKYTNHAKTAQTVDSSQTATNTKAASNSNANSDANLDKISTISSKSAATRTSSTISQKQEMATSMRTLQPKNRSDNHSVEPKKLGTSQRLFNLNQKGIEFDSSAMNSESFRIPLQKTRLFRAKMLSDLSEVDFDDSSSSSISERRRLPPLKVEIPFHDGHARAFQNYYDFLSSSENFEMDKENGPIKKRIKEKLLKRSSSVNPSSMLPRRSATTMATTKDDNLGLKRASTSNKIINQNNNNNVKDEKKPTNNNNNQKIDEKTNSNINTIKSSSIANRSSSENPKPTNVATKTTTTTTTNNNANTNSFVAHITVIESEKLSRVDTYFVLYIDGSQQAKRTRTVKGKTSWKEFNESFDFTITREKCNIVIQAKREDLINGDQLISSAKVNLITLPLHKKHDKWVPLTTFGRVRLVMTLEKESQTTSSSQRVTSTQNSAAVKSAAQNQPQAAMKATTGSVNANKNDKDAATFSLADEVKKPDAANPDLKVLMKITDEGKKDDPLLKSLVKSMSETKNIAIDAPTVNVPLLSESSSSDSDQKDDKNDAKRRASKGKTRSKSRNKSRKSKK